MHQADSSLVSSRTPRPAAAVLFALLLAAFSPDAACSMQSSVTSDTTAPQQAQAATEAAVSQQLVTASRTPDPQQPGATGLTSSPEPPDTLRAQATLISEVTGLVPGDTSWLALDFHIDEGWYLYWNGVNDTGYAPSLSLKLPPGYEAGPIQWPAPERTVSPGGILDHVYRENLTLIFPLRAPPAAKPGETLEFRGTADWLICRDLCIPERQDVSIRLPVLAEPEQRPHPQWSGQFEEARKRLPQPLPARAVRADWRQNTLSVRAPGANWIAFYPELDSSPVMNLLGTGVGDGGRIELRFRQTDGDGLSAAGVLDIRWPGGHHGVYHFRSGQ